MRRIRSKHRGSWRRQPSRRAAQAAAESSEPQYVHLPLVDVQIPIADVEKFIRETHVWIQNGYDLRVLFSFPESDGWLTRPHFAGGPSIQVKLLIREDQREQAEEAMDEANRAREAAAA